MRILIISAFDPLPGDEQLLIRYPYVAQALCELGAEVDYVSSRFFHGKKRMRDAGNMYAELPYHVHLLPAISYGKNVSLGRLQHHAHFAKQLKLFLDKQAPYSLIISAFPPIEANHVVQQYATKTGTPWIVDIQDAWPQAFYNSIGGQGIGKLATFPLLRKARNAIHAATARFAVSKDYFDLYECEGQAFPLGISEVKFSDSEIDFEKAPNSKVLLFMGSSGQTPFLQKLTRAWGEQAPSDCHLVLAGAADWIKKLQTRPEQRFWVYPQAVPSQSLLQAADIGLVTPDPSLLSRMPFKVFGYLSEGLSLMTNIQGGELERWLSEHQLGLSFDNSLEGFWTKLKKLNPDTDDKTRIRTWANRSLSKSTVYRQYAEAALTFAV